MSGDLRPRRAGASRLHADPDADSIRNADSDPDADGVLSDSGTNRNVERNADMDTDSPIHACPRYPNDRPYAVLVIHAGASCPYCCADADSIRSARRFQMEDHLPLHAPEPVLSVVPVDERPDAPDQQPGRVDHGGASSVTPTSCPLCGTPCRVVGDTTLHYEPVQTPSTVAGPHICNEGVCHVCGRTTGTNTTGYGSGVLTDKNSTLKFVRGAMWAYQELAGALIVPASFEESAREAAEEKKP